MNIKHVLAAIILAASTTTYAAGEKDNLTSKGNVLVKNSSGNCVLVKGNQGLQGCGNQEEAPPPAPEAPQYETINEVTTLGADAYFDFDKSNLKSAGREHLDQLVQALSSRGAQIQGIEVVGHTDSKGSDAYNQKLSERRASTVANYLVNAGVPAEVISARGEGERSPVADNSTEEGRAQNRRVDVAVQGVIQRQQQVQ